MSRTYAHMCRDGHPEVGFNDAPREDSCPVCDAVEEFYARVNARAEADILKGRPVTGAHHRALEAEIEAWRHR